MNVSSILRSKGNTVETAQPDWTVARVCARLHECRVGALVVSMNGRRVDGIVSERDVIAHLALTGPIVLDQPVSNIMERNVVTCARDDNIAHLMETMTSRRIRHLPVQDGGELVGIVSIGDVVKARIRETEREATALREYIATG